MQVLVTPSRPPQGSPQGRFAKETSQPRFATSSQTLGKSSQPGEAEGPHHAARAGQPLRDADLSAVKRGGRRDTGKGLPSSGILFRVPGRRQGEATSEQTRACRS